jgi:hypothetical protein
LVFGVLDISQGEPSRRTQKARKHNVSGLSLEWRGPVHQRLVEHELVTTDAQRYRRAARRLATMRKLAAGTEQAAEVDVFIAGLRENHRRRPRLQQEFDRAHLP